MKPVPTILNEKNISSSPRLLMAGVCVENVVGRGLGPSLGYVSQEGLQRAKWSHPEVVKKLRGVIASGICEECWVWNTCNRFEIYALFRGESQPVWETLESLFFEQHPTQRSRINRMEGRDAIHHLLRTGLGLNSGLPGETDVCDQLAASIRLSAKVGALRENGPHLIEKILKVVAEVRAHTSWGRFSTSYISAALRGVLEKSAEDTICEGPIVLVGSSSTIHRVSQLLLTEFGVNPRDITVYHRSHRSNGLMKVIRRAAFGCRTVQVEEYVSPMLAEAIGASRLAIFGIDRASPVLSGETLRDARIGIEHSTIVLDFNTFNSTSGIETTSGVQLIDAQAIERSIRDYAAHLSGDTRFIEAVSEAEKALVSVVPLFDSPVMYKTQEMSW